MILTKQNRMNNHQLFKVIAVTFLVFLFTGILSARDFPEKSFPPRLVNDFAGMLSAREINALERKLVEFNDSTSTQISIVIVEDLMGYDRADYAQRLAQLWGIGQKGSDNGILILVKPKTGTSQGQVFIAQGYGLEGVIPDITCGEIIDYEILPAFRTNDFYGGLDKATNTLMLLASGEFTADQYRGNNKEDFGVFAPFIFFIIFCQFPCTDSD